jgi:hypothetical protein
VQEFTIEFRKIEIQMGVSLKSLDTLFKYFGEFLSYIPRKLMLFRPKMIDDDNIQEKYLDGDKWKKQASRTTREVVEEEKQEEVE